MRYTIESLASYSSPYANWRDQFIVILDRLIHFSGEGDDFFILLLDELLPFIKHEYTIYNSILPALGCFSEIVLKDDKYIEEIVFFLEYVFQAMIRDRNQILVEPTYYYFVAPQLTQVTQGEEVLFRALQDFYASHRLLIADVGFRARYDVILLSTLENITPQFDNNLTAIKWLLAHSLFQFHSNQNFISDRNILPIGSEYEDIILAIQGRKSSEIELFKLLEEDVTAEILWAGGRIGAVSGLLLFLTSQALNVAGQEKILGSIIERCVSLKKKHEEDQIDVVSTDQLLLEDISTILFLEYRGTKEVTNVARLHSQQKFFLDLMGNVYHGHTYSLLYAGIGPATMTPAEIKQIQNIYMLN